MSELATFQCYDQTWVAEEQYGESSRHTEIAVAAHRNKRPFCRQHILGRRDTKDPLLPEIRKSLIGLQFDLSKEFDILVVRHQIDLDPHDELDALQWLGKELIGLTTAEVPDFAYLETIQHGSKSGHGFNTEARLTASEIDDLMIASSAATKMLLQRHND